MNIIIAPHVDDEIIGCYSLIKKGLIDHVVYLDATPERVSCAMIAGKELGFTVAFLAAEASVLQYLAYVFSLGTFDSDSTFLVPDASDRHPLHKAVNSIAKLSGCNLGYYSVDMTASFVKELNVKDKEDKKEMLNRYYFDQSNLWKYNWKYFLFEGIVFEENNG